MVLGTPFVRNHIGRYVTQTAVAQPSRANTARVVVHHAAWIYAPGKACQSIFSYHSSQWPKYGRIGYHEVIQIDADGTLRCYQVNPPDLVGAGVYGQNGDTFHICAATDFGNAVPDRVWQEALALRVAEAKRRWPKTAIVGHSEITLPGHASACPGAQWRTWKPALLRMVDQLLAPPAPPSPTPGRYRVRGVAIHEAPVLSSPIALQGAGFLLSGEEVEIDEIKQGGIGHLKDGRGFVLLEQLERV